MNYADLDALYAAIGEHHVSAKAVVAAHRSRELRGGEEQLPDHRRAGRRAPAAPSARGAGVHVEGLDDVMVRLSRCCTPVPGDEIMGFVTRGRGVSVHRADCANAVSPARARPTGSSRSSGTTTAPATFVVSVEVEALDRSRLLRDVADVLVRAPREHPRRARRRPAADRVAKLRFDFELADPGHLDSILWRDQADRRASTTPTACCPAHATVHAPTEPRSGEAPPVRSPACR